MKKQKKDIFKRGADAFVRLFFDMHNAPESEKDKKARLAWEAKRQEEKRQHHEKIMAQEGMSEFMDAFNNVKTIKVFLDKFYNPSWPLFEESDSNLAYEIGKYTVRKIRMNVGGGVYVDDKRILYLDKELLTMVQVRAKELNPRGVEKCEQEAKEWNGKQKFILAKGKEK